MKLLHKTAALIMAVTISIGSICNTAMISNAEEAKEEYRAYGNYLYSILKTDKEKEFYNDFLEACEKVDDDYTNSYTMTPEVAYNGELRVSAISELCYLFTLEHPEFFWLGNNYSVSLVNGKTTFSVNVSPEYQSGSAREQTKSKIYSAASSYIKGALAYSNPYDRAKYLHDALIDNITYGGEISETQTIVSAFLDNETVCAGYSKAYTFLCNAVGVNCFSVRGTNHEWNMVYVGGSWYCVDVTYDDQSSNNQDLRYKNFMLTYSDFKTKGDDGSHTIDASSYPVYGTSFPSCTDTSKGKNAYDFGDINNDGNVNSSDYTLLENYLNGKTSLDSKAKAAADTNSDLAIDNSDLQSLYNYINGVIRYLPDLPYMISNENLNINMDFSSTGIIGDVNGDSAVDSKDAVYILIDYARMLAGAEEALNVEAADVNSDGSVDAKDAVKVLKYYAESLVSSNTITPEEYFK